MENVEALDDFAVPPDGESLSACVSRLKTWIGEAGDHPFGLGRSPERQAWLFACERVDRLTRDCDKAGLTATEAATVKEAVESRLEDRASVAMACRLLPIAFTRARRFERETSAEGPAELRAVGQVLDDLRQPLVQLVKACPQAATAIDSDLNRGSGNATSPSSAATGAVRACREALKAWEQVQSTSDDALRAELAMVGIAPTDAMVFPARHPDRGVRPLMRGYSVPRVGTRDAFEEWAREQLSTVDNAKRWARDQLGAIASAQREILTVFMAQRASVEVIAPSPRPHQKSQGTRTRANRKSRRRRVRRPGSHCPIEVGAASEPVKAYGREKKVGPAQREILESMVALFPRRTKWVVITSRHDVKLLKNLLRDRDFKRAILLSGAEQAGYGLRPAQQPQRS